MSGPFDRQQALQRELVRYATLAPNSHNTQAWKFHLAPGKISIAPDFERRTPVVDPDDHHLFVTLGCALENMAQASMAFGLKSNAQFNAETSVLNVDLEPTRAAASPLYAAITERQSTRSLYDGTALTAPELKALESAGTSARHADSSSRIGSVRVMLFTAKPDIENILALVLAGNTAQMGDAAFVKELKHWIRFSSSQAAATRDGLYSATSGNPSVPAWLGGRMFDLLFKTKSENDKYAQHIRSSSGLAVFVSDADDKAHWVEAGRCYERFALQATVLGIRNAMVNQAVEVPAVRQQLAALLGLQGGRPDLVVRFGRGKKMPKSLRRDVEDVLV